MGRGPRSISPAAILVLPVATATNVVKEKGDWS